MKAIVLKDWNATLALEEIPMPNLAWGQVLVKMAAASINPSDLVFLRGQYGIRKPLPVVPGFEGSGVVVDCRGSLYGRYLMHRRVACRAPYNGNGTWSEFMAVDAAGCVPLRSDITLEEGAAMLVNPLTAVVLLHIARERGHWSFFQTAAASALGRMMDRLARRRGMTCVNIVRRSDQATLLKQDGAEHVIDSSEADFESRLRNLGDELGVTLALDAVGGPLTEQVASAQYDEGGQVIVYGALSGKNTEISPQSLIFENVTVEGFWLTTWLLRQSLWKKWRLMRTVQERLKDDLRTHVQARFPLERFDEALHLYKEGRSNGKVLLVPEGIA